jgi:glucuronoarabinoxylan endo-1,4-beta-xylanase
MHSATDGWAVGQGGLMLKYQNVTSVEQTNADAANISLYPNPVHDQLTILHEGQTNESTFRLLDQTGRQIISGKLNIGANQINVSELPAGMYFIQIQGAQKAYKVIKL